MTTKDAAKSAISLCTPWLKLTVHEVAHNITPKNNKVRSAWLHDCTISDSGLKEGPPKKLQNSQIFTQNHFACIRVSSM